MSILAFLAVLSTTPATFADSVAQAKAGDTIRLGAGRYGTVSLNGRRYQPALRIDAGAAHFTAIRIVQSRGIVWQGGTIDGRNGNIGATIDRSSRIQILSTSVTRARVGIVVSRSTDVDVIGNVFNGVRSDGIDIAMSQRVRITGNACMNFRPIRAIYASDGRLLVDGDHADCIQGWSRRGYPPTSDITIENNAAEGEMQGISFFDPGQGGYDRIHIANNVMTLRYWNGITILEGRDSSITRNTVRTEANARQPQFPFKRIVTRIHATGAVRACGNVVEAMPKGFGTGVCR